MPEKLFERYVKDPLGMDNEVRSAMSIRDDRYYTVSVWPVAGMVTENDVARTVRAKKVSKSDQQ